MKAPFRLWDLPTRLFHWSLAGLCLTLMITGQLGALKWHMLLGPAALVLVLFRLGWGLVGSSTARFAFFLKGPAAIVDYLRHVRSGQSWPGIGHNPLGAVSVLAMLTMPVVMVLTGLFTTDDIFTDAPLVPLVSHSVVKLLSGFHRVGALLVQALVGLHLAAIAYYYWAKGDNLVVPMIKGHKASDAVPTVALSWTNPIWALPILAAAAGLVWGILFWITPIPE